MITLRFTPRANGHAGAQAPPTGPEPSNQGREAPRPVCRGWRAAPGVLGRHWAAHALFLELYISARALSPPLLCSPKHGSGAPCVCRAAQSGPQQTRSTESLESVKKDSAIPRLARAPRAHTRLDVQVRVRAILLRRILIRDEAPRHIEPASSSNCGGVLALRCCLSRAAGPRTFFFLFFLITRPQLEIKEAFA